MVSLFVVTSAFDNVSTTLPHIRKAQQKGRVIILALDFWAARRLHQLHIAYKTPGQYFDAAVTPVDTTAIEMARCWYGPISSDLQYRGISLGTMAEYDFAFLFIDALRCIEIAATIISREKPDVITLPTGMLLAEPPNLSYEALPGALDHLARLNLIPVKGIAPAKVSKVSVFASRMRSLRVRALRLPRYFAARARHILQDHDSRSGTEGENLVFSRSGTDGENLVFFCTSTAVFSRIAAEMDSSEIRCTPIVPSRLSTEQTRQAIAEVGSLSAALGQAPQTMKELTYRGVPLLALLDNRFQQFFSQRGPRLVETTEWLHREIELKKPGMLVVIEDVAPIARNLARLFKLRGLPVLVIQHGALLSDTAGFEVMPLEADKQAVWGDLCRQWHLIRGRCPESQVVTGNPRFDPIALGYDCSRAEICQKLNLDPGRGIILVATEWGEWSFESGENYIRTTLKALLAFPEKQIVVKLHPAYHEHYRRVVQCVASEENVRVTITEDYLWDLIVNSEVVIISNSTVGLEAMILHRPVIVVNSGSQTEADVYVAHQAALEAHSIEEIVARVGDVLNRPEVRASLAKAAASFVNSYACKQDGKASRRVAELIRRMLEVQRTCRP